MMELNVEQDRCPRSNVLERRQWRYMFSLREQEAEKWFMPPERLKVVGGAGGV